MTYISSVWAIFRKDLAVERRSREILSSMLVFALLSVIIFVFSFELSGSMQKQAFAGAIWVSLSFAGTLGLTRSFNLERENNAIEALLLAPIDRSVIFFGKALANWVILLLLCLLLIPSAGFFFGVNPFNWTLLGITALGTLGYTLCGTFLASITSQLHNREVFLPLLLFPLLIPLLTAAVHATNAVLNGGSPTELGTWLLMLAGYDILFTAVGLLLFDKVIAE